MQTVKSPSDTTIYAPALQKRLTPDNHITIVDGLEQRNVQTMSVMGGCPFQNDRLTTNILQDGRVEEEKGTLESGKVDSLELINQDISNFVETVRQNQHPEDTRRIDTSALELEQARLRADKNIVDAERFKATVEQPPAGRNDSLVVEKPFKMLDIGSGVSDDDFFHLTCHIEPSLIHKIEKGEFIELEKLLPKDKIGKHDEGRLEWVQRDGGTYLVPAQKDNKIGSFRRWEQAFRAYATIYCGANPHRLKEIWQYITVINTAASSYTWENVYNYDITFRHLMAFNPNRS